MHNGNEVMAKDTEGNIQHTSTKLPQMSLSNSQYEEIFDAVINVSNSEQGTPTEIGVPEVKKMSIHTPHKHNSEEGSEKRKSVPSTPIQTPGARPPVSPWGSHFSRPDSQSSSIVKELQETQSSLLNSSSIVLSSDDTSSVDSASCGSHTPSLEQPPEKSMPRPKPKVPKVDQRKFLEEMQQHRNVGVWVFCCRPSCQKQRYLANVTDPQDVPQAWYCHMNPDPNYNSCQCEEKLPSPEEEEDMIYNKFTAGSVVWARVDGYPWWPAMVDDDPDLAQYYWLLEDWVTVTYYHVVFFDERLVTRAWVDLDSISPYAKHDNKFKLTSCRGTDFTRRIHVAKEQANKALKMPSYQRLTVFSFIARYKGAINTSRYKANKTVKKYKLNSKTVKKDKKKASSKDDTFKPSDTLQDKCQRKATKSVKRKGGVEEPENFGVCPKHPKMQTTTLEESTIKTEEFVVNKKTTKSAIPPTVPILSTDQGKNKSNPSTSRIYTENKPKKLSSTPTVSNISQPDYSESTEDEIGSVVESSQPESNGAGNCKHTLMHSNTEEPLDGESADGIVPEVSGFSQTSYKSLPFEE